MSQCSGPKAAHAMKIVACPRCGTMGPEVARETVGAMAALEVPAMLLAYPAFRFCETPSCDVVYYADGVVVERTRVRMPVHTKDAGLDVPLCYCFGYTRRAIAAEIVATGHSTASAVITREIAAGHCACELRNPSGRCCLGDVRAYEKRAARSAASARTAAVEE